MMMIIDHGQGYMTLYGNNSVLYASVGDSVEAGQLIASAGQSDLQLGIGLYFEIRHNSRPINPKQWLRS